MNKEERLDLMTRVLEWVYFNTESWDELDSVTLAGLLYLVWAIGDNEALDVSIAPDKYTKLLKLLEDNPNDLLLTLKQEGFIV